MLLVNLILFLFSLFILIKSAEYTVRFASRIARVFRISEFIVSFFLISIISCFPEATVSIISSFNGVPEFGLGALLGSNVADLCLVFGLVAVFSKNGITVKSAILKNNLLYLFLLLVPIILGLDGHFSRADGILLVLCGAAFFVTLSFQSRMFTKKFNHAKNHRWIMNLFLLILCLAFLIASAYFTVDFGVLLANELQIPAVLIALTLVSIGTCMPELVFSLKAVRSGHDGLALGDLLGTVIIDATIIIGILALISPFNFNPNIIYFTGLTMFFASGLVILFIKSEKVLSRKEGVYLLIVYVLSLIMEFVINHGISFN